MTDVRLTDYCWASALGSFTMRGLFLLHRRSVNVCKYRLCMLDQCVPVVVILLYLLGRLKAVPGSLAFSVLAI